jgi:hypothetical protein
MESPNGNAPRLAARSAGSAMRGMLRSARPQCTRRTSSAHTSTTTPLTAAQCTRHTLMHTARHLEHTEHAAALRRMQHLTAHPSRARAAQTRAPARGAARREQRPALPSRAAMLFSLAVAFSFFLFAHIAFLPARVATFPIPPPRVATFPIADSPAAANFPYSLGSFFDMIAARVPFSRHSARPLFGFLNQGEGWGVPVGVALSPPSDVSRLRAM